LQERSPPATGPENREAVIPFATERNPDQSAGAGILCRDTDAALQLI
jgi:hypothetical protein